MANTASASSFASKSMHVNYCGVASGSELKATLTKIRSLTHNGLKSLNSIDELRIRRMAKSTTQHRKFRSEETMPSRIIVCGMTMIFVGMEVGPWSKTGGLGDVLGGLPPAMAANGHRVMTIAPRYDQYKDAWDTGVCIEVEVREKTEKVRFFHCYKRGVDRVFVDHPVFLEKVWGKTGSKIYGPTAGEDYENNQLRFSLLCQVAALEAPRVLNLGGSKYFLGPYGEEVVFIANDWHTALIPCYLKTMYKPKGIYKSAKAR